MENVNDLTLNAIKKRLLIAGLSTSGKKDALTRRLKDHLSEEQRDTAHDDKTYERRMRELELKTKELELAKETAAFNAKSPGLADMVAAVTTSAALARLPTPEPPVFDGNPLHYRKWDSAFDVLIVNQNIPPTQKLFYLERYLTGAAKEAVSGFFVLHSEESYNQARALLEERFGNSYIVAEAFRTKIESWPRIPNKGKVELRSYADFLKQCQAAKQEMDELRILDDPRENKKMLQKLPEWLTLRWSRKAHELRVNSGKYPSFEVFVQFMTMEADILNDPITSSIRADPGAATQLTTQSRVHKTATATVDKTTLYVSNVPFSISTEGLTSLFPTCSSAKIISNRETQKSRGFGFVEFSSGEEAKRVVDELGGSKAIEGRMCPVSYARQNNDKAPRAGTDRASNFRSRSATSSANQCTMIVPVWLSDVANPTKEILTYAMLDTQSDTTFIDEQLAEQISQDTSSATLRLTTMTSTETVKTQKHSGLVIRAWNSDRDDIVKLPPTFSRSQIPAEKDHVPTREKAMAWPHLQKIAHLLSPLKSCSIGLLVGYDCASALAPIDHLHGSDSEPYAIRTRVGWSIIGKMRARSEDSGDAIGHTYRTAAVVVPQDLQPKHTSCKDEPRSTFICKSNIKILEPQDIGEILTQDFNSTADETSMSQDDIEFMRIMNNGIRQTEEGHYCMPLPFRNRPNLPNNRSMAEQRLQPLLRRFKKDQKYFKQYSDFIESLLERGEAEMVPQSDLQNKNVWYIPHHGVYHPRKPTKLRVVFDCAAKFRGEALNTHLLQGPDLNNALLGVLCRFRVGKVALTCDVERMFHQFRVDDRDTDFLRFLWQTSDGAVRDYRMKVHLFGSKSSPGCATFGLQRLASDNADFSQSAAKFIQENFYVDDGLLSVESSEEAIKVINDAREICSRGNLRLHKVLSNKKDVINALPESEVAASANAKLKIGDTSVEQALGIQWCLNNDTFQFDITLKESSLTRRGVLSMVASIYDPLGFLSPVVLPAKHLLQELCQQGVGWDDSLSEDFLTRWRRWFASIPSITALTIPRCHTPESLGTVQKKELHHFSDASAKGYGQCSYLRLVDETDTVHCSLVMAKSRVAPLKPTTIPRLELQAAVLNSRISELLRRELHDDSIEEYYWTDSKVVLGYINNDAKKFHVYVANRIQRIKQSTQTSRWNYVPTADNPADMASRGTSVAEFLCSDWLSGPAFLWDSAVLQDRINDNIIVSSSPDSADCEVRRMALATSTDICDPPTIVSRFEHFSDWSKLLSGISMLLKAAQRFKNGNNMPIKTDCSLQQQAAEVVIKSTQRSCFMEEITALQQDCALKRSSTLYKLDPFLDDNGVLRVGGRLSHSQSLSYSSKHPIILPKSSHATILIIRSCHETVYHQGRGFTMNEIRSQGFWIINGRALVSKMISDCVICRKLRLTVPNQKMANLPDERLEPAPPFSYCGIDCFGPFLVTERRSKLKKYGLMVTCMASRAVHLELLDDLSTDAFINSLRCVISLRGNIREIRCDRGTNFVGASNELQKAFDELDTDKVHHFLLQKNCDFIFNFPYASHMGGVWERQIRTVRSILTSMLAEKSCTVFDTSALRTFFCEITAIINSRPLSVKDIDDPAGPEPLTPNHLLLLKSEIVLQPPGDFDADAYSRKRWRRVQCLTNQFWRRWRQEYLQNLQERPKWQKKQPNLSKGDVVIVHDESVMRTEWKLGRVIDALAGADGLVRKVRLLVCKQGVDSGKQGNATIERPSCKVTYLTR